MTDFYSQNRCVCSTLRDLMGHCYVHFAFLFTLSKEKHSEQFNIVLLYLSKNYANEQI